MLTGTQASAFEVSRGIEKGTAEVGWGQHLADTRLPYLDTLYIRLLQSSTRKLRIRQVGPLKVRLGEPTTSKVSLVKSSMLKVRSS